MNTPLESKGKDTRLVARVHQDVHDLISRAAELSGSSLSQFMVEAAMERAEKVTERATQLKLTMEGAESVLAALDQAPEPGARLQEAARRYKEEGVYDSNHPADQ